jgi:hypothetical protein
MINPLGLAGLAAVVLAAGLFEMAATAHAQSTAQTKATVANEAGNPIDAPETVDPGQQVSVSVPGAGQDASVEVWGPVGEAGKGQRLASVPLAGGSALVTAPLVSASYELRYIDANGSTRAHRAFEVAASPVMLEVPVEVNANAMMQVTWRGPAKAGDMLQIVDPATGMVLQSTPVAGDPGAPNVSELVVPDHSGPLELRYVALDGTVLRSIAVQARRLGG